MTPPANPFPYRGHADALIALFNSVITTQEIGGNCFLKGFSFPAPGGNLRIHLVELASQNLFFLLMPQAGLFECFFILLHQRGKLFHLFNQGNHLRLNVAARLIGRVDFLEHRLILLVVFNLEQSLLGFRHRVLVFLDAGFAIGMLLFEFVVLLFIHLDALCKSLECFFHHPDFVGQIHFLCGKLDQMGIAFLQIDQTCH